MVDGKHVEPIQMIHVGLAIYIARDSTLPDNVSEPGSEGRGEGDPIETFESG